MAVISSYWGLDGIILLLAAIAAAYLYMTRKFNYWRKRGVLEVPPSPFLGNYSDCIFMKKSPGEFLKDLYDRGEGADCVGFYIFDKPFLLIRDPGLIKNILVKDFNYFIDRYAAAREDDRLGAANLFILKSPAWKTVRSKLSPIFTSGKLKKMFDLMTDISEDLQTYLESCNLEGNGQVLEMKEVCAKFTTDMIATTAFGLRVNSLNNPEAEFRKWGRQMFHFTILRGLELTTLFFAPKLAGPLRLSFFPKKTEKFLRSSLWGTINERIKSGNKRNDLIDLLIELKNSKQEIEGFQFDGDDLVAQAAVFFTAGFETSSTAISFTLYELALQPEIQNRLRKEIHEALEENNGEITYEMVVNLPYLDMVVSETLRKFPPLPLLDRVTAADYKVPDSNVVIEKGTPIFIPLLGLHWDPDNFPNPEQFDPERFSEENKKARKPFTYMPFGDGPRNCIGLRLGLLQSKLGLVKILSQYEVSVCDKTPIPLVLNPKGLITSTLDGLYVNVRKIPANRAILQVRGCCRPCIFRDPCSRVRRYHTRFPGLKFSSKRSGAFDFEVCLVEEVAKMAVISSYWGLDGIILFLAAIAAAYLYMTRKLNYWKKRGVLEIPPSPFVGNFSDCLLMKKCPGEFLKDLYNKGEGTDFIGIYIFHKPFLLVRDPGLIKHILVKDFNYFADRHISTREGDRLGAANLILLKNPAWKTVRSKLSPIFTSGKLKKMFELMTDISKDLQIYLESCNLEGTGQVLEVKEICAKFATDLIGTTAFGLRVNSLNNPEAEFRKWGKQVFNYSFKRGLEMTLLFFAPKLAAPLGLSFFEKDSSKFLRSTFWGTINERIKSGGKRNDLIDLLVELKNSEQDIEGFKFDGDDLVAQAAIFFTAGFETSSTTMSFSLYELALHPEIQNRLRTEIHEALERNNGEMTYEMVTGLPYLDMVISETLRKYPPLAILDRMAIADYKIPDSNLVIEKGTPIFISLLGLHWDPEYFPNPERFDPERFSEENKKARKSFTYMPFGDGPRNCIGLRLGLLQTKLGLVKMLSEYEVSVCDETPIPLKLNPKGFLITSLDGLYINVRKIITKADEWANRAILQVRGCSRPCIFRDPCSRVRRYHTRFSGLKFSSKRSGAFDLEICLVEEIANMAVISNYWGLDGIILFLAAFVAAYLYMTRKFNYWKKRGVFEVSPSPFFGNFFNCLFMKKSPGEFLKDLYEKGEGTDYVGFYIFDKPSLLLRDPGLIKHVLIKDFNYFVDRYAATGEDDVLGFANLFMLKNPAWKTVRTKLTPMFSSGRLKRTFDLMTEVSINLQTYLDSCNLEGKGQVLELKEICAKFTTDLIGTTAFGLRVNSLNNPHAEFRKWGKRVFDFNFKRGLEFTCIFLVPELAKMFRASVFEKNTSKFLQATFWSTINERIKSGNKRNDLIDLLVDLKHSGQEVEGFKFDGDNLVAQSAIFFTAGFETSSSTISFTLYELTLHPEIQSRLRNEILEAMENNNGEITYEMVTGLRYLDMVVSETLRKYPPLPILDRIAVADYKVPDSNLVIEKGTPIFISLLGLQEDPQYFPNPEEYDPERFSEENKKAMKSCTYLPFGDGSHSCIGLRLGLLQSKLGLISILSKYEISVCDETSIPLKMNPKGLMLSSVTGIYANVRRIKTDTN
ncbi:uncharacterized protein LOC105704030 [Orussus abietinus]|uniref:uncharacterized protein LOC105704030 n=1 Tax=Orussus abietinus TaxID=222816 RepID=UPI000C715ECC|nr:uncharacterized protein LOC105704030 [Orussus abietinus]